MDPGCDEGSDADERMDGALAIKACLDSLKADARQYALTDLERFLELAALAAEEVAAKLGAARGEARLRYGKTAGRC